ncbi:hypothetical protein [Streptomyces sp. NPDC056304]|uniref:hypothetical protein n=1 Tax=Streptomyces sp. NPDC056304 TaxID=3345778 RepID=UPI0035DE392D
MPPVLLLLFLARLGDVPVQLDGLGESWMMPRRTCGWSIWTAVIGDGDFAPGKGVIYRMSPANPPCLAAARPEPPCLGGQLWGRVR